MINNYPREGIWLATMPADMRLSYDGLTGLIRNRLNADPLSGAWYIFINRRRTMMKVIAFDRGGYWIWSKRLESGLFAEPTSSRLAAELTSTDLTALIDGIDIIKSKKRKRHQLVV